MATCKNCGAPMVQMVFTSVCKAECDLQPILTPKPLRGGDLAYWQSKIDDAVAGQIKITAESVRDTHVVCRIDSHKFAGWGINLPMTKIVDGTILDDMCKNNHGILDP